METSAPPKPAKPWSKEPAKMMSVVARACSGIEKGQ
jgi:hypothetical protein